VAERTGKGDMNVEIRRRRRNIWGMFKETCTPGKLRGTWMRTVKTDTVSDGFLMEQHGDEQHRTEAMGEAVSSVPTERGLGKYVLFTQSLNRRMKKKLNSSLTPASIGSTTTTTTGISTTT
jgi:hypothetical protein